MASSSRAEASGVTRKLIRLTVAVLVFAALYTGAWFYGASWIRDTLSEKLAASQQGLHSVSCGNPSVRGFPFRIGLFCDSVGIDDRPSGLSATFGALRSAAQVYRPGHAVLELDGPAQVRVTPDLVFDTDWELLHASAVAWTNGLERASVAYDGLKGRLNVPSEALSVGMSATHGESHVRQSGEALDVAASFKALSLDFGGRGLPPLDVTADMTLADAARWISTEGPPADVPLGTRGELRRLSLDLGDGKVAILSGPLAVGDDGYVSGTLDLDIAGITVWRDRISQAFPEIAETAVRVAEVVQGLSKGGDRAVVKLNVRDGTVYLGLFPIAFIPPF